MKFLLLFFLIFSAHCNQIETEPITNPQPLEITPVEIQSNSETSQISTTCQFVDEFSQCAAESSDFEQLISCSSNFSNSINTDEQIDTNSAEFISFRESVTTYDNCIERIMDRVEEEKIINKQLVLPDTFLCTESYISQTKTSFLCE